jgi:hypothetical protein
MSKIVLSDLSKGMDLKNAAIDVAEGFTGENVGLDWSDPGVIQPLRVDALVQTMADTIIDSHIVYIQLVKYQFTTHADGLRVTTGGVATLIDSEFTGFFKCLGINDQYVVLANATLVKKWLPGWTSTDQWGVDTPPKPTLSLAPLTSRVIDACESLANWVVTGGSITLNTTSFAGTSQASINMAASANSSVTMSKTVSKNLAYFNDPGDLGTGFISLWVKAPNLTVVTALHVLFDCSTLANFTSDWYECDIPINNVASTDVTFTPNAAYPGDIQIGPTRLSNTQPTTTTVCSSGVWMNFQIPVSSFYRIGNNANRDWSKITAIQIKFDCGPAAGSVLVTSLNLEGGGYPFGNYWFAVAYEDVFGNYGPYSLYAGPVNANGQQIIISGLTPDTNPHTTQRRFAVIGGSLTDPMVFFLSDNVSTSYTYNLQDTALSTIETNFNEDQPQPCTDMILAFDRIFMISGDQLLYSDLEMYEGFPADNYISFPGEILTQIALYQNQYIAVRGVAETLIQILSSDPGTWAITPGAREGSVSSRFMIDLGSGQHVWAGKAFFWQTADNEYLPQIGFAVKDFAQIFGAQISDLAYLFFVDTDNIPRILRIDYRPGYPLPHYIENIRPSCIFADLILKQVFYAIGNKIYQFNAGTDPMPTILTIPEQFAKSSKIKSFAALNYDLQNGPLTMQLVSERKPVLSAYTNVGYGQGGYGQGGYGGQGVIGSYSLPDSEIDGDSVSLPPNAKVSMGFVLTSTDQDFILTLPVKIEYVEVE